MKVRTGIKFLLYWSATFHTVAVLAGEEILHPTLIDPAKTKCMVCHPQLEAPHGADAMRRGCLSCHTFVLKADATYLVTGDDAKNKPARVEPPNTTVGGQESGSDLRMGGASPTAVPANAGIARPSGWDRPENQEALYEKGLAAFERRDFAAALESWRAMFESAPTSYTVQIAVNRYLASADEVIRNYVADRLFIVQVDDRYFVLAGLYPLRSEAERKLASLPEPLRQGGAYCVAVKDLF